jgi:polysaccharide biosynthesis transport protein
MSVGLGVLLAGILGPAVWVGVGYKYTAESYLRISMEGTPIAFQEAAAGVLDRDRFEIYKNTQQQLLLSRFVLMAALRKTEVAQLPVIQEQTLTGDPVVWLAKRLSVSFPGRAELMAVSLTRDNPKEAATLVNAVVGAYLTEVVNAEGDRKLKRLSELQKVCIDKETIIRSKREDLKKLAEQLGTSDSEALTLRQKLALEELTTYRQELAKARFDLRRAQGEMAAQRALLKSIENGEVTDAEVDALVQNDPTARQLFVELGWRKIDQAYMEGAVVAGAKSRYADRYQQDLKTLQDQFNARRAELVDVVRQKRRSLIQTEIQKLENAISVMKEQENAIQREVDKQREDAKNYGSSTVDIEMMRAEIRNLEQVLTRLATEREQLQVESRSTPRITPLQRAEVPETTSNDTLRMALTLLATLAGLGCPAAVIILWDAHAKRISSSTDVSQGLRLPVIGSVPLIPARVIRRLGSSSKRCQMWHVRLTESINGIAARVLLRADRDQSRVIMVSSAAGGEGKTTLATQLALSLNRTGRRTILVDFDLRRPSFDEVFGLPLEPGVCEVLRQQESISNAVHQLAANNLAVMTAGRWDRNALASLSNGSAAAIFKKLREDYEFVVVDTSPILPVADARFVSQHVDSVVLAIFRDLSEAPKIQAACEILSAFGVPSIEAVVTGLNENRYGQHLGYESTISA